jgi:diaminopimelate epimerase
LSLLKYEALGNDFIVVPDPTALAKGGSVAPDTVRALCDRRHGLGADGLLLSWPAQGDAAARLEVRNADGSRAETSGNGLRCFAAALVEAGRGTTETVSIEADGRLLSAVVSAGRGCGAEVSVSMGQVAVGSPVRPAPLLGETFESRFVDVGNPHLVLLGGSLDGVDIEALGAALVDDRPGGQNVEVVEREDDGRLRMLVYERGAGLTLSCGSGSCAAAAAARASRLVGDKVEVLNPGGSLLVEFSGSELSPEAWLAGPVRRVAKVDIERDCWP